MISGASRSEPSFIPAMPNHTIEGSVTWRGMDLRKPGDFTHQLTQAEIIEVDDAVQGIARQGIDHIAIDRHNFELPQLGERLTVMRDNILMQGRGFIVIRGFPLERYSIAEAAAAFL